MIEYQPIGFTIADYPSPLRIDGDGVVRVGPTRVTLDTVISAFQGGATAEQIADDYDSLGLADVYATIDYYVRHREDVDRYLALRAQQADRIRQELQKRQSQDGLKERLLARRAATRDAQQC